MQTHGEICGFCFPCDMSTDEDVYQDIVGFSKTSLKIISAEQQIRKATVERFFNLY